MNRCMTMVILVSLAIVLLFSFTACSGSSTSATGTPTITTTATATVTSNATGGGAVVNSDSIITGTIQAIRPQTTSYSWELDVLIQSAENVGDLPNPVADKVGQVVTVKTDEDMSSFKDNQAISARVKYTGDVPKPGITLYMYEIKAK